MIANTNLAEVDCHFTATKPNVRCEDILLIESDLSLASSLKSHLLMQGYRVVHSANNSDMKEHIACSQPKMIVLDIGNVDISQLSVLKDVRALFDGLLVVISAKSSEQEQIQALNLGADEYLIKPVSPNILVARVLSLFRRQNDKRTNEFETITIDELSLQIKSQKCLLNNKLIKLTGFEFNLLKLLMNNVDSILSRDMIYSQLLGRVYNGVERTVDVRMSQLREKLSLEGMKKVQIETIWGQGYMLSKL